MVRSTVVSLGVAVVRGMAIVEGESFVAMWDQRLFFIFVLNSASAATCLHATLLLATLQPRSNMYLSMSVSSEVSRGSGESSAKAGDVRY